jgi:hypothetical protein
MDLGEIRDMKTNVKNVKKKAKKQIDELIEKLKKNDFLKNPKIQNLIERVQNSQTNLESGSDVSPQDSSTSPKKSKTKNNVSQQLLDLIKTSDVANRIAAKVLSKAEGFTQKLKGPKAKKKTAKKAASKSAASAKPKTTAAKKKTAKRVKTKK